MGWERVSGASFVPQLYVELNSLHNCALAVFLIYKIKFALIRIQSCRNLQQK